MEQPAINVESQEVIKVTERIDFNSKEKVKNRYSK
jgi:hypothetical protein